MKDKGIIKRKKIIIANTPDTRAEISAAVSIIKHNIG